MKMKLESILRSALIFCILVLLCMGCTSLSEIFGKKKAAETEPTASVGEKPATPQETQPKVAPEEKTYYVHTVKWQGESLSIISAWYTGKIENWKVLASANPNLDPNRIFPGDKISIPEDLLKTRKPMPEGFVSGFLPKPKEETSPPESSPQPREEEPKLFKPKGLPQ